MSFDNHETNDYNIEYIIEKTKERFSNYINYESLNITVLKNIKGLYNGILHNNGFDIKITIDLSDELLLKKYNFDKNKYKLITPLVYGNINLDDNEGKINIIKVGLFTSNNNNFTEKEMNDIKKILGNKGIGSMLVLIFIYFCYIFNEENPNYKIDDVSLDDSSSYPGWYKNISFEYPDDDEYAVFKLTDNNFENLQRDIYKYSNKRVKSELNIFNKDIYDTSNLNLLSNVSTSSLNSKSKKRKIGGTSKKRKIGGKSKKRKIGGKSKKRKFGGKSKKRKFGGKS